MHGLIQAFSQTNRILNSIKTFGNIVCFRNLQKRVDSAIALFGNKDAGGIVILHSFDDYFNGFTDQNNNKVIGYKEVVEKLETQFPLEDMPLVGEQNKREFISLFGAFLRMRNLLSSFDELLEKSCFHNAIYRIIADSIRTCVMSSVQGEKVLILQMI